MGETRICYISPASIHTYRWVDAFVKKGYKITLITDSKTWVAPKISFAPVYYLNGLTIRNFPRHLLPNILTTIRLLKKINPQLVHLHVQHHYSPAIQTCKLPYILTSWGIEVLSLPYTNMLRRNLARIAAKKAWKITTDGKCLKEIWMEMGIPGNKIEVIFFGVDLKLFNPKIEGEHIRNKLAIGKDDIVIISTRPFYNSQYNVECLIQAASLILKEHSNVKFILKGEGPLKHYLKNLVKKLKLSENFRFVGITPYNQIASFLNASDIYVSTCFIDSTSVSLLEAMACALPPVVTDIPGNREWIQNGVNGFLYPPKNFRVLAEKIIHLIEDLSLRKKFGKECWERVKQRGTWEKSVALMENVYKTCLES